MKNTNKCRRCGFGEAVNTDDLCQSCMVDETNTIQYTCPTGHTFTCPECDEGFEELDKF